jgi:hypothetical protein
MASLNTTLVGNALETGGPRKGFAGRMTAGLITDFFRQNTKTVITFASELRF